MGGRTWQRLVLSKQCEDQSWRGMPKPTAAFPENLAGQEAKLRISPTCGEGYCFYDAVAQAAAMKSRHHLIGDNLMEFKRRILSYSAGHEEDVCQLVDAAGILLFGETTLGEMISLLSWGEAGWRESVERDGAFADQGVMACAAVYLNARISVLCRDKKDSTWRVGFRIAPQVNVSTVDIWVLHLDGLGGNSKPGGISLLLCFLVKPSACFADSDPYILTAECASAVEWATSGFRM